MRLVIAVILVMVSTGCATSSEDAKRTVYKAGFTNVKTSGVSPFSCSEDDMYGRKFTATNANGQVVEGVVCCGLFKNCTIRY
jgi:hypothetical protein